MSSPGACYERRLRRTDGIDYASLVTAASHHGITTNLTTTHRDQDQGVVVEEVMGLHTAALTFLLLVFLQSSLSGPANQRSPLVLLLATDGPVYGPGQSATITLALDNQSQSAVPVTFSSAQRYDVVAVGDSGEVWRWSSDRAFAAVESEVSFPPGVTLLGRVSWDMRGPDDGPLKPGIYRLVGSLTSLPSPLFGNEVIFDLSSGGPATNVSGHPNE
jgi:hypothetical protein